MPDIHDNIHMYRKRNHMTLEELGKKIGTTRQTIGRYENGEIKSIPYDKIVAIANVFGVSPSTLMGWESDEEEFDDIIEITTSTSEEADLLECFRELSEMKKAEALRFLNYLLYQEGK